MTTIARELVDLSAIRASASTHSACERPDTAKQLRLAADEIEQLRKTLRTIVDENEDDLRKSVFREACGLLPIHESSRVETIDLRVEGAAEIAAASEALGKVEEHVRRALCGVLDRLGADGATAFMNGDSPEVLSDDIYRQVLYVRDLAKAPVEVERDNALNKLDVAAEVIGEVRGVCKAGEDELTAIAVRRALQERDDRIKQLGTVLRDAFNDIRDTWEGSTDTETMELLQRIGAVLTGGLTPNHHLLPPTP